MLEYKITSWMFSLFLNDLKNKPVFLHWAEHSYLNMIKKKRFFCSLISRCFSLMVLLKHNIWGVPLFACAENGTKFPFPLTFLRIYFVCIDFFFFFWDSITLFVVCFGDRTEWGWRMLITISMAFDSKDNIVEIYKNTNVVQKVLQTTLDCK